MENGEQASFRGLEVMGWGVWMEKVRAVLGGKGMEGFVGEEDFVVDVRLDWEPVKVNEGWGDVLPGLAAGEFWTYWSLSRVLLGT